MQSTGHREHRDGHEQLHAAPQQINQTVNLGTAAAPTMLYVKGEYDPDSLFRGLAVDGTNPITGYGILVVEDSDLGLLPDRPVPVERDRPGHRPQQLDRVPREQQHARSGAPSSPTRPTPLEVSGFSEFAAKTDGTMRILASKENIDRALHGPLQHADLRIPRELGVRRLLLARGAAPRRLPAAARAPGSGHECRLPGRAAARRGRRAHGPGQLRGRGREVSPGDRSRARQRAAPLRPRHRLLVPRSAAGGHHPVPLGHGECEVGRAEEHEESRRWLVRVGRPGRAPAVATAKRREHSGETAKKVDPAAQGSIEGQTQWPGVTPAEHSVPAPCLACWEPRTRRAACSGGPSIPLGERFEFKEFPEGPYRVVGDLRRQDHLGPERHGQGRQADRLAWSQADSTVPVNTFPLARAVGRVALAASG